MTESLRVIGHFIFQIIVGAVLFAIFAGVATLISFGAHWIDGLGAPYEVVLGGHVIEILLFLADMVCFIFFIFVEVWKLLKEMALGLKKGSGHV